MRVFLSTLQRLSRFEVRLGKIAKYGQDSPRQKQVDALLAIDLVKLTAKQQISKAILIAGDGDHVPAVKSAKEEGSIVDLYFLRRNQAGEYTVSADLYDCCDDRFELTALFLGQFLR